MPEWFKGHAWKACVRVTVPKVRIPASPNNKGCYSCGTLFDCAPCMALLYRVKSQAGVDGDEPLAEDKGVQSDLGSEGSRMQKIDLTYRNRIQGTSVGDRALDWKALKPFVTLMCKSGRFIRKSSALPWEISEPRARRSEQRS